MLSNRKTLLSAVTTGTGAAIDCSDSQIITLFITGAGTITGGTLVIEESDKSTFSGTWSTVQTFSLTVLSGGAVLAFHQQGAFGYLRGRLTSNVTGGGTITVTVRFILNA